VGGVEAERTRAAVVQDALYRIAELASAAQDMQEFYRAVHEIVGGLMDAPSFWIALYDEKRGRINWPYFVDDADSDPDVPDPRQWFEFGEREASGVTAYILRTEKLLHVSAEQLAELVEQGAVERVGTPSEDWLGVPLRSAEARTVGVLAVSTYAEGFRYTTEDEELLAFVGQHIGSALSRARAIEETRQRNAELALINSVQEALAGELEMQAIYDLVGDRIRDVFDAQGVFISALDQATGVLEYPYVILRDERLQAEPTPLAGFSAHVLETQESLLIAENFHAEVERYGSTVRGEEAKSALFVPLITAG
jgi:GAF domain-containing protein